ncbi:glycosyltransferase family 39 protein [Actinotalea subterranea]|uniref:glycosyltransferase family 39 protein n=1 Tax=Actinotalea subterranea TaxID=2607497 RepID=UPI0011EC6170|nr:glycosyltransferase family 39 protein [Actinotalea subterranea]
MNPPGPVATEGLARRATLAGLATALVALVGSWHVSLWSDEVATISAASRDLGALGQLLDHIDAVHGTYYALMHAWVAVFGASPFSVRLPSALAVGAAAAGVHLLAGRLAGRSTAVLVSVVLAVLPRVTWAGIEARPFAVSLALGVWLTVLLHGSLERPRLRRDLAYGALLALAVAVNLYLALLPLAHLATVLVLRRGRTAALRLLGSSALGALLVSPILVVGLGQAGQLGSADRGLVALVRNVVVNQWFLGETPTATTASGGSLEAGGAAWKVAAIALAALCWVLVAVAVAAAARRRGPATPTPLVAWALPWLVVPTVALVAASVLSPSAYNPRYLTFCAPGVALLVGAALRTLDRRLGYAVLAAVVVLAAPVYASQRTTTAKSGADLALVAEHLDGRTSPGDGVYFASRDGDDAEILRSSRTVSLGYPGPFQGLVDVTLLEDPATGGTLFGTSVPLADAGDRLADVDVLWVVRRQDRPEQAAHDDALLEDAGLTPGEAWDGPQLQVVRFERR